MKTITKTFYVCDSDFMAIKSENDSNIVLRNKDESCYKYHIQFRATHKIQISWQEPERKIEITESEFDEYVKDFFKPSLKDISPMNQGIKMQTHLKQKLFGVEK